MRMSTHALRHLTDPAGDGASIARLALTQIAEAYDEELAMVPAIAPASLPQPCVIPGFHLAFCLAVAEHGVDDVPFAADVARRSLERWRARYVTADGVLDGFASLCWWFVDWDPTRRAVGAPDFLDDPSRVAGPDAVTHAWLVEACRAFGVDAGIDVDAVARRYRSPAARGAYRLHPAGLESPHATAAIAHAFPELREDALDWLIAEHARGNIATRCTPYFLTFVARALALRDRALARQVVRDVVGARVARYGTVPEKVGDTASLAHGWSVGFVDLFIDPFVR
jgi:hypothetical protein